MNKRFSLIVMFFIITYSSFAQWNHAMLLNSPGTDSIKDVDFVTENSGMYCYDRYVSPSQGNDIYVQSTFDGGFSWGDSWANSGYVNSYAIKTVRSQQAYYYAYNWEGFYRIIMSADNGDSWRQIKGAIWWFTDLSAVDTSHVFFIHNDNGTKYYLDKYINNVITMKVDSFTNFIPSLLFFTDSVTGYVAASTLADSRKHVILKTSGSGLGWSTVFSDTSMNIRSLYFTNDSIGFLAGDSGHIIKTIDGGQNWQQLVTNTSHDLYSIFFVNDLVGYAAGDAGLIMNTQDGGITWNVQSTGITTRFKKLIFVNDSTGFALTGNDVYKIHPSFFLNINEEPSMLHESLAVYPNPANGVVTVESTATRSNIEILNTAGAVVYSGVKNASHFTIDISSFIPGIYILREIQDSQLIGTQKVVVMPY